MKMLKTALCLSVPAFILCMGSSNASAYDTSPDKHTYIHTPELESAPSYQVASITWLPDYDENEKIWGKYVISKDTGDEHGRSSICTPTNTCLGYTLTSQSGCSYGYDSCDDGCGTKKYKCKACTPTNTCSGYTLTSQSGCSYGYDSCDNGCGTKKYKCKACTPTNTCSGYTLTSQSGCSYGYDSCDNGCGTKKYKCKACTPTNTCSEYTLTSQSGCACGYDDCNNGCGTTKYKCKACTPANAFAVSYSLVYIDCGSNTGTLTMQASATSPLANPVTVNIKGSIPNPSNAALAKDKEIDASIEFPSGFSSGEKTVNISVKNTECAWLKTAKLTGVLSNRQGSISGLESTWNAQLLYPEVVVSADGSETGSTSGGGGGTSAQGVQTGYGNCQVSDKGGSAGTTVNDGVGVSWMCN